MASCSLRAEELVDQFESSCAVARPKNQSSLGPYIYTPLCDPSKEFRLVTLHPGRAENNDIECSLQHGHLSDHTEFEALSYAWGDQIEKHTIMLDKHSFEVTSNLAHALRNLRNVGPSNHIGRVFWIDAICINQEDVTECNDQVRRMDIIYTRASQVVVWLGRYSEPEDDLVNFEQQYGCEPIPGATFHDIQKMFLLLENLAEIKPSESAAQTLNPILADESSSLCFFSRVFNRPWFHRLWVFQEANLSRATTLVCGNCKLDWVVALDAAKLLANTYTRSMNLDRISLNQSAMHSAAWRVRRMFTKNIGRTNLGAILEKTSKLQCSDPRDKLAAVLGIMGNEDREDIDIDYARSIGDIYINWIRKRIERTDRLDMFLCCNNEAASGLPSWVPSLSTGSWAADSTFSMQSNYDHPTKAHLPYSATGTSYASAKFSEDGLQIKLLGYSLGKVTAVSASGRAISEDGEVGENGSVLPKILKAWEDFIKPNFTTQSTSGPQQEKFFEVLFRGFKLTRRSMQPFHSWCRPYVQNTHFEQQDPPTQLLASIPSLEPYAHSVLLGALDSQIIITDAGSVGIVKESCNIDVGDIVHLLLGGSTPYILRPVTSTLEIVGDDTSPQTTPSPFESIQVYRLMGSCYLQGYMDGEAMSSFRKGEIRFSDVTLR